MRRPFSYFIRKYPLIRFCLFFLIMSLSLGSILFFSFSTLQRNTITAITPQIARPGDEITLQGNNFGTKLSNSWVMIGTNKIKPDQCLSWTNTEITFKAPADLHEDLVYVVTKNKQGNNTVLLVNASALPVQSSLSPTSTLPVIETLSTTSGAIGSVIAIYGKNFGHTRRSSSVIFTGMQNSIVPQTPAKSLVLEGAATCSDLDYDYEYWSDRELRVRIPDGADSGDIVVATETGTSNPLFFNVKNKAGSKRYTNTRTYHIVSEVEISDFDAALPNTLFLRVPIPQQTNQQHTVTIDAIEPKPFIVSYQGASLHRFHNIPLKAKTIIKQEYKVERSEVTTEINEKELKPGKSQNQALHAAYTEATALFPTQNPAIKELCKTIVRKDMHDYYNAKKIYAYLIEHIALKPTSITDIGKSLEQVLKTKQGDAYDLTMLFCTLARAAGIPAIPTAGILVTSDKKSIMHWWAEFYVAGFGWVPVDPALGAGMFFNIGETNRENKTEWYFGNLDAYRIAFSRGLQPQSPMVPSGKIVAKERSYAFMSIWEETTSNVKGYSSLWRLPKIVGIY
ncbi:MAG: transglutaminase domain-containing protein [Treponema sp.]